MNGCSCNKHESIEKSVDQRVLASFAVAAKASHFSREIPRNDASFLGTFAMARDAGVRARVRALRGRKLAHGIVHPSVPPSAPAPVSVVKSDQ